MPPAINGVAIFIYVILIVGNFGRLVINLTAVEPDFYQGQIR